MFDKIKRNPNTADLFYYKIMSFANDTISFIHDNYTKNLFKKLKNSMKLANTVKIIEENNEEEEIEK